MKAKDLINYTVLSNYLAGNNNSIRKNNCPLKYEDRIKELEHLLQNFIEGNKLFTEEEIKNKLKTIDLYSILYKK